MGDGQDSYRQGRINVLYMYSKKIYLATELDHHDIIPVGEKGAGSRGTTRPVYERMHTLSIGSL